MSTCGECPKRQPDGWCVVTAAVVSAWRCACGYGAALIAIIRSNSSRSNKEVSND